jgi:transposase
VHIETLRDDPESCSACGTGATIKDRATVSLVDLPAFGRPARLVWRKRRWRYPDGGCSKGSWAELAPSIAASRLTLTDRAGRWVTEQVGRYGRTVAELAP